MILLRSARKGAPEMCVLGSIKSGMFTRRQNKESPPVGYRAVLKAIYVRPTTEMAMNK